MQDGSEVSLRHVVGEGTVAKYASSVTGGLQLLMPLHYALRQQFHLFARDLGCEAGDQYAATDAVDGLTDDGLLLDGHAQVEAKLEQQFVEHVRLAAVALQVVLVVEQRLAEVVTIRLP